MLLASRLPELPSHRGACGFYNQRSRKARWEPSAARSLSARSSRRLLLAACSAWLSRPPWPEAQVPARPWRAGRVSSANPTRSSSTEVERSPAARSSRTTSARFSRRGELDLEAAPATPVRRLTPTRLPTAACRIDADDKRRARAASNTAPVGEQ